MRPVPYPIALADSVPGKLRDLVAYEVARARDEPGQQLHFSLVYGEAMS